MKTQAAWLRATVERFRQAGLETPELDARVLIKHAFDLGDAELITGGNRPVSPERAAIFETLMSRRLAGEPVARLVGHREFWGMRFDLSPETLVPRPDSEILVEAALAAFGRGKPTSVLDLGTGTGCLLLAILSECPEAQGLGVDLSGEAVATAQANAERLGMAERVSFTVSDWDARVEGVFDLIVSNPPYIPRGDIADLEAEVRFHDPLAALDGGPDGLDAYHALAEVAKRRLAESGVLVVELGIGQEEDVAGIMAGAGLVPERPAWPDLGGISRALIVRR